MAGIIIILLWLINIILIYYNQCNKKIRYNTKFSSDIQGDHLMYKTLNKKIHDSMYIKNEYDSKKKINKILWEWGWDCRPIKMDFIDGLDYLINIKDIQELTNYVFWCQNRKNKDFLKGI